LLRGVRFSGQLGFDIEEKTAEAMSARAKLIGKVSSERIRDEMDRMLLGPDPAGCLSRLLKLGLLEVFLPEVAALKKVNQPALLSRELTEGDLFLQLVRLFKFLSKDRSGLTLSLAWAALLGWTGKKIVSEKSLNTFNGFEKESQKIAETVCTRLRRSKKENEAILLMIEQQLKFREVFQMRESTLTRFVSQPHFLEMLHLQRATALSADGNLAYFEFAKNHLEQLQLKPRVDIHQWVRGEDLIELGLKPGPTFARIMKALEDEALEGRIQNRDQAFDYILKNFVH
jgi:poly(A) polymerase